MIFSEQVMLVCLTTSFVLNALFALAPPSGVRTINAITASMSAGFIVMLIS